MASEFPDSPKYLRQLASVTHPRLPEPIRQMLLATADEIEQLREIAWQYEQLC